MIEEHDIVVLTQAIAEENLPAGAVGTVVQIHPDHAAYVVEFLAVRGQSVGIGTVLSSQLRPIVRRDIDARGGGKSRLDTN